MRKVRVFDLKGARRRYYVSFATSVEPSRGVETALVDFLRSLSHISLRATVVCLAREPGLTCGVT